MAVTILIKLFVYYFIGVNVFAFITMGYDKLKAKFKKYRITEKFLINTAIMGGSFGTLIGMLLFRHKIRSKKFFLGVPFIIFTQILLYFYIASFLDRVLK